MMLRAVDALLTLAPLLLGALLYGIWFRRMPGRLTVLAVCVAVGVLAAATIWQGTSEGLRPHERYVPAKVHDGEVEEGHGG